MSLEYLLNLDFIDLGQTDMSPENQYGIKVMIVVAAIVPAVIGLRFLVYMIFPKFLLRALFSKNFTRKNKKMKDKDKRLPF